MSHNDNHVEFDSDSETRALTDIPVVSHILTPGSSLHPTFLLVVDGVFVFLLLVLMSLLFITGGNLHFSVLICISLALWASVKWFVRELRQASSDTSSGQDNDDTEETKKDK